MTVCIPPIADCAMDGAPGRFGLIGEEKATAKATAKTKATATAKATAKAKCAGSLLRSE